MNRRLLVLILALLVFDSVGAAAQSRPVVRVAFVHDRSASDWAEGFRDSLSREIARVLDVDYTVEMSADLDRTAEGTVASVRDALVEVLSNEKVDLIVATGPLGSLEASRLPNLTHPVIGTWILDPEVQKVPFIDGTSGHPNFTYITMGNLLSTDLAALDQVVKYDHLVIVGSAGWVAALPGDGQALAQVNAGRTSFVTGGGSVDSILASLPEDADAIYLLPMIDLSSAEITVLLEAFVERQLPVLSLTGEPEVRAGALVGAAPADWKRRVYRRVALLAAQILSGERAADIPVMMLRDDRLFLNLRTAARIGVSPSFEVIIEAVMIGEIARPGAERFDLRAAMAAAQTQNRDIATSAAAVAAGLEQVNVAKAELFPQINLGLAGLVVDENSAALFPTRSERTFSGNATLTQLIYSDRAWAGYTVEKHLQEARLGELDRVRLDVGLEAATAYLDVLRAQTRLAIRRQDLAFSRTNRERAQVRVSVGDANRSELYRWQSKIAGDQTQLMDAVVSQRLASLEFNRVLARPQEAPLDLVDTTVGDQFRAMLDPRVDRFTGDPHSLAILREFLVQTGLASAPELRQFDASILATERTHSAATRSFWVPDIGLAGSVNQIFSRGGEGTPPDDPDATYDTFWQAGVFLSLPLFEGSARFAETRRTNQETYRLMHGRQAAADRIEQNVRNSVFDVAASRLAIDLAGKAAEAARLNLDIVADNYTLGLVSLIDLLDAQTNALNTNLAAIDAVNDYLLDLMRVERAVGRSLFFAPTTERESWIAELEKYASQQP